MTRLRFIISFFGDRYLPMLPPLLFSIKETNPDTDVSVFWEDINQNKLEIIKKAFPKVEFIETNFNYSKDRIKRISSKTNVLEYASRLKLNESNEILVFLDVDTLVIKDINSIIENHEFDVMFTTKDEKYPLNTGVTILRNNPSGSAFSKKWKEKTMEILNDKFLFAQANNPNLPYGGADQMALYQILNFDKKIDNYLVSIGGSEVNFKSIPCSILNETNSTSIKEQTCIIHYKGGWQPVLLDGHCFTKKRTREDSLEMYIYYLKNFLKTVSYINKETQNNFRPIFFGIKIPSYFNRKTWKENRIFFILYSAKSFFLTHAGRIKNIKNKIDDLMKK